MVSRSHAVDRIQLCCQPTLKYFSVLVYKALKELDVT